MTEEEAARWERELAQLEGEAALSSVTEAYQAALDAANENVDTLSSQILGLEAELSDAMVRMERSIEDKERIGAEYAFLAKNYGELLKNNQQSRGREDDDTNTAVTALLLEEEISGYTSRIAELETRLENAMRSLAEAREEVDRWKELHDAAQSSAEARMAAESRSTEDAYELKVLEAAASLEEEKARVQEEANRFIDRLQSEFDAGIDINRKMISALRQALRKTRKEKSYLEEKSSAERTRAVEEVRERMTAEVANLKAVLRGIEGEMDEKEEVMRGMVEGREETEKLMEEIRYDASALSPLFILGRHCRFVCNCTRYCGNPNPS